MGHLATSIAFSMMILCAILYDKQYTDYPLECKSICHKRLPHPVFGKS
jgi:hypothetical protein